jgi:UDP-N-acetylbacillosamine N-acetyltransferase
VIQKIAGLVILGFGGHARSVADVAVASGIDRIMFIDENGRDSESFLDFPVVKEFGDPLPEGWQCFATAGDNRSRMAQTEQIRARRWPLATIVSPTATIGIASSIGAGTFVGHHCHVGPRSRIGEFCILNTGCIVEHDCEIGDYTHVSINATLAGRCRLGRFVFIGAGATVIHNCSIGDETICGAGSIVTQSISVSGTYVGVPARLLSHP